MLLEMVQLSLDGKYLAKGYSNLEYNLTTVVYELGDGHCLSALQKSPFTFRTLSRVQAQDYHRVVPHM
jgi:hypothetical protein